MPDDLARLLAALAEVVATETRPEAQCTAEALLRPLPRSAPHAPCEMDSEILSLSRHPKAMAAAALLAPAQAFLPWGRSPVAHLQPGAFSAMKTAATLLGPDGPIFATDLRFGLYYQRPETYYALHNHEAAETYTILAGSAFWTAGQDQRWRHAGEMIHHPPRMPHAFRAGQDGVLAIWRWSGDIRPETYRLLPDPSAA